VKKTIFKLLKNLVKRKTTWKDAEYFDEAWKNRIKQMAAFIPQNATVLDLGCGKEWLKEFLPYNCCYWGCDYVSRNYETIICDFNKYQFPNLQVDICFVSGCLEYVEDYSWFIQKITEVSNYCIISYCSIDYFPNLKERTQRHWVNHLRNEELIDIFLKFNFSIEAITLTQTNNLILVFKK
jgi:hypothetical protein